MERKEIINQLIDALENGDLNKLCTFRIKIFNRKEKESVHIILDKVRLKKKDKIEKEHLIKSNMLRLFLKSLLHQEKDKLDELEKWLPGKWEDLNLLGFGIFEETLKNLRTVISDSTKEILQKDLEALAEDNLIEDFTIELLFELQRNTKDMDRKVLRQNIKLLEDSFEFCFEKIKVPFLLSYVSGLFDLSPELTELKQKIERRIEKNYYDFAKKSRENIEQVKSNLEKIENELQDRYANKEKEIDQYWKNKINEEKTKFVRNLIKIYEMLVQTNIDAVTLKVDPNSNLYKRISVNLKFTEKEIEILGAELIGKTGEIVEFDRTLHQNIDKISQENKVEILIPGFRFRGEIIKKPIVKSVKGGK